MLTEIQKNLIAKGFRPWSVTTSDRAALVVTQLHNGDCTPVRGRQHLNFHGVDVTHAWWVAPNKGAYRKYRPM